MAQYHREGGSREKELPAQKKVRSNRFLADIAAIRRGEANGDSGSEDAPGQPDIAWSRRPRRRCYFSLEPLREQERQTRSMPQV